MSQLHLTAEELQALTHVRRPSTQARALEAIGVPLSPPARRHADRRPPRCRTRSVRTGAGGAPKQMGR